MPILRRAPSARKRRLPGQAGSSLMELMLAMAIALMAIVTMFSTIAPASRAVADSSDSEAAADSIQGLSDWLRNYVSADYAAPPEFAPGGSWKLPGDDPGCAHALDTGCAQHNGSAFLSRRLLDRHPAAALTYTATAAGTDGAVRLQFTVTY